MQYFRGVPVEKIGYCKCQQHRSITSEIEEWGYWDVCCVCGKPLEDGFITIIIMMVKITMT